MFKNYARFCAILITFSISFSAVAAQLTVEEKTLDFQQLIGRVKAAYGPLLFKKESLGIDIDALQAQYLRQIQESKTNQEFYYLINRFVSEFRDSHFVAQLPTNRRARLPFTVELIQGKVFIDEAISEMIAEKDFPFSKGDEVVAINGVPTEQALQEILPYVGEGFLKTQRHFAAWMLTSHRSARIPVPQGPIKITVRTAGKAEIQSHSFEWEIEGEDPAENFRKNSGSFLRKISIKEKVESVLGTKKKTERRFICSGETRTAIPEGATVVSKTPFVSYYYPTPKGQVGYMRIPHYYPEGEGENVLNTYFSQYEKVIRVMEAHTVGLVIDQDHNCGGYVDLVNRMLGLFMDKPYHPLYFKMVANKENYLEYKKYADEVDKLTTWHEDVMKVVNLLKDYWQRGVRMTSFTTLNGDDYLQPNMIRYTKPVVILIDEMSGSGGDGFPALMQGYGRAKLIGTRTMGAGGHVQENPALNYSQISVTMTRSLFFRPDGVPVENNGAVPDFPYDITYNDFMNEYKDYQNFYTTKLLDLIK